MSLALIAIATAFLKRKAPPAPPSPPPQPPPPDTSFALLFFIALAFVAVWVTRRSGSHLTGKRVLIRVAFDAPPSRARMESNLPMRSVRDCVGSGAKSVVLVDETVRASEEASLKPVASMLAQKLGRKVTYLRGCSAVELERACDLAPTGAVVLVENVRFQPDEAMRLFDVTL